ESLLYKTLNPTNILGFRLAPAACTDSTGRLRWAAQRWDSFGQKDEIILWSPAVAAGLDGAWAQAWDYYPGLDYDVEVKIFDDARRTDTGTSVASSSRSETRPALAYDPAGRLWIAYEEGPEKWGKDYGALEPGKGEPLYSSRSVRVVCLQDGKLY